MRLPNRWTTARAFERRGATATALLAAALLLSGPAPLARDEDSPPPSERGIVERSGVTLMLVDVEVTDENGNPLPGLTADDFAITLDGRTWPLYSVDELCDCPVKNAEPATAADSEAAPARRSEAPQGERVRFVIYIDFSQLTPWAREASLAEARRWIAETKQPDDEVMLVAYATRAGLRVLSDFTADPRTLLAALEATGDDPTLVDPFPAFRVQRQQRCLNCCESACDTAPECCVACADCHSCTAECLIDGARAEHSHGKHSLEALRRLVTTLEPLPGRKALILFHENGAIFPARFYAAPEERVGDHLKLLDGLAAEATLARASIYIASLGDAAAVNLGANLADLTGGRYSRGAAGVAGLIDGAGRGCACIYRLAIQPPDRTSGRVYRVKVDVRDRALPFRYRVQFLDEVDRWWRRAQEVLTDPAGRTDVAVDGAIVPVRASVGAWDLDVRVALDVDSLTLFPLAGKRRGEWEVGALLVRDDGRRRWEMIGNSSLLRETETSPGTFVVHERRFEGLKPGSYRLRTFVRDRAANVFGGSEAAIELPPPGQARLAGPILVRSDRGYVSAPLPLLEEKASGAVAAHAAAGPIPTAGTAVGDGESLEATSWICAKDGRRPDGELLRFISDATGPRLRFDAPRLEPAGDCFSLTDSIGASALGAGEYAYHLRWLPAAGDPVERDVRFAIAGNAEPPRRAAADPGEEEPIETVTRPRTGPARAAADEAVAARREPDPRLARVLRRMANVAKLYEDNALSFTCNETIHYTGHGSPILLKFRYLYRYSKSEETLEDYRVPRSGDVGAIADRVDLASYGLPVVLLRAYSWVFIFLEENQPFYRFELRGQERGPGPDAIRIDFEAIPPYRPGLNEWFGSAWVDAETYQLLRVEARHSEDLEQRRQAEIAVGRADDDEYLGSYPVLQYSTEFDVVKNGMRFPGRALIEETRFRVLAGKLVSSPGVHVSQTYKRYRFFSVRTAEEIREIVQAGE